MFGGGLWLAISKGGGKLVNFWTKELVWVKKKKKSRPGILYRDGGERRGITCSRGGGEPVRGWGGGV